MSMVDDDASVLFDEVSDAAVELANSYGDRDEEADPWVVAGGLLAGAIQFWLFAHQPCDEPDCDDCAPVSTSRLRMKMLLDEVRELAEASEYFHTPNDADAGRA